MADLKIQNSSLRRDIAAKEAQLAVVQAEFQAWRRVQGQPALDGKSSQADGQREPAQVLLK